METIEEELSTTPLIVAELDYLVSSKAATASLSENYVGLPY